MRIALVTGGSRGDAQPYLALGVELRRRGHEVVVVTYDAYEQVVEDLGLSFARVSGDAREIVEDLTEAGQNVLGYARRFRRVMEPLFKQQFDETLEGCRGADAVVFASVAFLGFYAGQALSIPAVMAEMQPLFEPTHRFPSSVAPEGPRWLRGPYNRLSYSVVRQIYWQTFRPLIEEIEVERTDLPPTPKWRGPWETAKKSGLPVLCGWSPRLLPRPSTWGEQLCITGYWFLDRAVSWSPPLGLERLLQEERPIVAMGFSSVRAGKVHKVVDRVARVADAKGIKIVLLGGWSGIGHPELPASVFPVEEVPHEWLFPRVAGVVHHGGAGTTAAALRAGVPSVILPFSADQAFWGRAVERAGAGVLATSRGSDADIEKAFSFVFQEPVRTGAAEVGAGVRRECGASVACDVIERSVCE